MEYEVFARIQRGDRLSNIGVVEAPSEELARIYASYIYDEENWVEMCVVNRKSIRWVKKPDGLLPRR
jgi:1,2-phenylacetyl-CoA epoxidase PaaB subunit